MKQLDSLESFSSEMPTLILHIGGAKCGSSALQTFLSQNPNLKTIRNQEVEYWRVYPDIEDPNNFKFAPVLVGQSDSIDTGYLNSIFPIFSKQCIHSVFAKFMKENATDPNKVFVFSCEGWSGDCQRSELPECACENITYQTVVYLSVRPQIQILVPAFLQWILWTEVDTLENALNLLKNMSDWSKQIENSYKLGANEVVSVFTQDIVENFSQSFEIDKESINTPLKKKINSSLPNEAVVLLLRNRILRPGAHHGGIDFLLEKLIQDFEIPTTPVELTVPSEIVEEIDEFFTESNARLIGILPENQGRDFHKKYVEAREKMLQNPGGTRISSENLDYDFLEKLVVALLLRYKY
jgi:hypothetical protein